MIARRQARHEMTRDLANVASGKRPPDLVIRNGRWVNVHSGETIDGAMIAVCGCRIAACGKDIEPAIGPDTTVIEADGRYLVPGFLDAHVHIESSMLTVSQFAAAVLPHGTTGVFIDPHEIANVLGLDGVQWMADEAKTTPLNVYVQIPSCVPAAPAFETNGATIGSDDVTAAMEWPNVIGLGEVMNYPGVAFGDASVHAMIAAALRAGGIIGGHYASPDLGSMFHAYVAGGPSDCHEGTRAEDVIARVRQGMAAMLREGSACRNVAAQARAVVESGIDMRSILLCTDDRHPDTLVREGHMDGVIRTAIRAGIPAIAAIQMATLNTAEYFGVAADVGSIAPGRFADILIVEDLDRVDVHTVIAAGQVTAKRAELCELPAAFRYPEAARGTVRISERLTAERFEIHAPSDCSTIECRVIHRVDGQILTRQGTAEIRVQGGLVRPEAAQGLAHLAVVERHRGSGKIGRGFVAGFGLESGCALASTVAHDSHNLLVVGTDTGSMAVAANRVADLGGGYCLVRNEAVLAEIPLPIAGLMSDVSATDMARQSDALRAALCDCGCDMEDALVALSFLALPVIPQLRLTDQGLVDVDAFKKVSLFVDEGKP